ncbi:MAG: hypothetical protein ACRCUP_05175 [Mycoplasmatales bacterium]
MSKIRKVEYVSLFVLKIVFDDGMLYFKDWEQQISDSPALAFIRFEPRLFTNFNFSKDAIFWINKQNQIISFSAQKLYVESQTED